MFLRNIWILKQREVQENSAENIIIERKQNVYERVIIIEEIEDIEDKYGI